MDYFNYMVYEMLARTAVHERLAGMRMEEPAAPKRLSLVTSVLASSLVRLGLRLDPAAGAGLGGRGFSLARTEARS